MRVSEIFYSIQGEGRLAGIPSVFIRTSGCNLRCTWCDTPYTSWRPEGVSRGVQKIIGEVEKYPSRHVVLTGGEPFLAPDIGDLTAELKRIGKHVTVETAATIFKPVAGDLMSLSPKLGNSTPWKREHGRFADMHNRRRLNFPAIQAFIDGYDYQIKFVVERRADFNEIGEVLAKLNNFDPARVMIMAQGTTKKQLSERAEWIVELCKEYGYGYTPRLHIELFGNRRGT